MNLRVIAITLVVIFSLVLQATIFAELAHVGLTIVPDLVLIIAVSYGLLKGPWYGGIVGLTAGLLSDLYAGGLIGVGALNKMLSGFLAGLLEKTIFKDNLLIPAISLLVATVFHEFLFFLIGGALGWHFGAILSIIPRIFVLALYNAALAPLVYQQFHKLEIRCTNA